MQTVTSDSTEFSTWIGKIIGFFSDERFDLLTGPNKTFLSFLCELVHPVVRPDHKESGRLVQHFNDQLQKDGWQLIPKGSIAGRPYYGAGPYSILENSHIHQSQFLEEFQIDRSCMQKKIERVQNSIDRDPEPAIGTAKDLVKSCCKTILAQRHISVHSSPDLPKLVRLVAASLELVQENISSEVKEEDTVKKILGSLSTVSQNLAELHRLYGTGHGREGGHKGLQPRHARLATSSAITYATFVFETHQQRSERSESKSKGKNLSH